MFSYIRRLHGEDGQALTEAPVVITTLCILSLILFQPVVTLYTKMVLGAAAASLCRVVATRDPSDDAQLLQSYSQGKIAGLPRGSAFQVPGSLQVDVSGDAHAEQVRVRLSLTQKTLPLIGLLAGDLQGGTVEVSAEAHSVGALAGLSSGADLEYPVLGQVH
ncbi:MAG: hypothetical protein FWC48_00045 [Actinomycetia bacterium]|nr:hypothetical protein [Actinomycetes bacterium]